MTFKHVVANSGFNKSELATLYGVSRQQIHYWINISGPRKSTYTARMEEVITATLVNLIASKHLPWAATTREARAARIAKMAERLQGLKPAPKKK